MVVAQWRHLDVSAEHRLTVFAVVEPSFAYQAVLVDRSAIAVGLPDSWLSGWDSEVVAGMMVAVAVHPPTVH